MLSLLLLQHALAPGVSDAHARSRLPAPRGNDSPASRPYLKIAAIAPPLRFNSPPPPPDLTGKPTAGAPPQPLATTAEVAPVLMAAPTPAPQIASPVAIPTTPAVSAPPTTPPPPPPSAILPDDTRTATKAEDFLPFFQFPANGGDVNVVVPTSAARAPAPGQLPPSSATYQQK